MAGSAMTFTYDKLGPIKKIIVDWTSDDTTGAVSGTTAKVTGELIKGVTDPGSAAPTDDYDIVLTDEEGVDVLGQCIAASQLINRDTANSEQNYFFVLNKDASPLSMAAFPVVADKLTVSITNAGNSKTGQLILYVRGQIDA